MRSQREIEEKLAELTSKREQVRSVYKVAKVESDQETVDWLGLELDILGHFATALEWALGKRRSL